MSWGGISKLNLMYLYKRLSIVCIYVDIVFTVCLEGFSPHGFEESLLGVVVVDD